MFGDVMAAGPVLGGPVVAEVDDRELLERDRRLVVVAGGVHVLGLVSCKTAADVAQSGAEQHELRGFRPPARRHDAFASPQRAREGDRRKTPETERTG